MWSFASMVPKCSDEHRERERERERERKKESPDKSLETESDLSPHAKCSTTFGTFVIFARLTFN